jgi:hypothetical protein
VDVASPDREDAGRRARRDARRHGRALREPGGRPALTGVPLLIAMLGIVLFVQAAFVLSQVGALRR